MLKFPSFFVLLTIGLAAVSSVRTVSSALAFPSGPAAIEAKAKSEAASAAAKTPTAAKPSAAAPQPEIICPGTPLLVSDEGCAPLFPFVISKVPCENVTNAATWEGFTPKPAGADGFIRVENGQFVNDAGVIHFFGTNLSCGASFPESKADTEFLARSLARFGINIVRLHFLDAPSYLFGKNPPDLRHFDPTQTDKLDYLIYQLEKNGIYVNLNLHVARKMREKDGFPGEAERPKCDKGLDNFEPRLIELQKEYARDYLTRVNPYTKLAYVNDPGVAMIEINNENSIMTSWRGGSLETLPEPFSTTYQRLWNEWLARKYASSDEMHQAWNCRWVPDSGELLANGSFQLTQPATDAEKAAGRQKIQDWSFVGEKAEWTYGLTPERVLKLNVQKGAEAVWAPQFHCVRASVKAGIPYRVKVKMRSASGASIFVGVSQMASPWTNLGCYVRVEVGNQWQEFEFPFAANADEPNARIGFSGLPQGTELEVASVSLHAGGTIGAEKNERFEDGTVRTIGCYDTSKTPQQVSDMVDFLLETENRYFQELYHFVKDELKARQPISGTQLRYGSWYAQSELDYCDIHSYWNHPGWLGNPWDRNNWYVRNTALVNHWASSSGTSNCLANSRVWGLPLTVSEYDHPYPNFYSAEGLPEVFALGAFQDWNCIYQYTWQHSTDYDQQQTNGYFDMTCNQGQLAHALACRALFLRDVTRGPKHFIYAPKVSREQERTAFKKPGGRRDCTDVDPALPLVVNAGLDLTELNEFRTENPSQNRSWSAPEGLKTISSWDELPEELGRPEKRWLRSESGELYLNYEQEGNGYFTVNTPKTKVFTGFVAGRTFEIGNVTLLPGKTRLDWFTFSMTDADAHRTLLTATGFIKNTGMEFEAIGNDRITCRANWGTAPVLCEGIPMKLQIRGGQPDWKCYALSPDGSRKVEVPVRETEGGISLTLSPDYQTIWYELVR